VLAATRHGSNTRDLTPVADEAAAEREERLVDLRPAVVADEQPLEVMEPGEGALDHPAGAAEPGAVLGLATGDLRLDAAQAELARYLSWS
jgi:hypothetical protein